MEGEVESPVLSVEITSVVDQNVALAKEDNKISTTSIEKTDTIRADTLNGFMMYIIVEICSIKPYCGPRVSGGEFT